MKKLLYFIAIVLLSVYSGKAQDTKGTNFWLTFGKNSSRTYSEVDLQIRIVGGGVDTNVTIEFTESGEQMNFPVLSQQVWTYSLTNPQKQAVYNTVMERSFRSIHVTSDDPVTVYALNQSPLLTDGTNVLPVTALDIEYYQISYTIFSGGYLDAYAVIATESNTTIYHDGSEITPTPLSEGEVYYYTSPTDMTGAHITSNKPIAFFAANQIVQIPNDVGAQDNLFQQLSPVKTWGKNFFVPVSHLTKDRVRIVASKDNTKIEQEGGTVITGSLALNAGQWVELEVLLSSNGCYISADEPIGVCTYLTGMFYNNMGVSDPAQAWLPAIEQTAPNALIAPFIPTGSTNLTDHYAIVMIFTGTEGNTEVSIGGAPPVPLTETWYPNNDANMSFCHIPLTDQTASYYFTNNAGLIVMGYGVGIRESYYYLAGSSMRNLSAAFSANGVPYTEMADSLFCVNEITFTTHISNIAEVDSMKWYKQKTSGNTPDLDYILITDIVEDPPLEWTRTFRAGNYMIKLEVYHNGELEPLVYEGELCVGAHITIYPTPNDGGMTKPTTGCYKVGTQLPMEAYPY
jgi:hypothetical protein